MISLSNLLFELEQVPGFNVGPVYHGGTWDGSQKAIKVNGRGALGIGAYFTPIKNIADYYAKESGGQVTTAFLNVRNPLEIYTDSSNREHPVVAALVSLGMNPEKASAFVEREEEKYGYIGSQLKNLAQSKGYDGIYQYFNGNLREIVIWNKAQVKPINNQF